MDFLDDGTANGGVRMSRRQALSQIEDLLLRIDDENEKKEALLYELARVERAIERWKDLLRDMEALLG